MGKFFSAFKNQTSSLVTILALFIVGAYYFFIYIPSNEKTVQERRFRCLQNIDNNIREKIDGSKHLMQNILESTGRDRKKIETALNTYSSKDIDFTPLHPTEAKEERKKSKPLDFVYVGTIKYAAEIKVDSTQQQLQLFVTAIRGKLKKDSVTIGMLFDFTTFIKPLLPPDIFDNYIVFVKETKVYESFHSELNYDEEGDDSLLQVKNKIITPGVRDIKIGGTDYKIFSQPIYTYTGAQWVISGLVSNENYQKEKNQLPIPVVEFLLTAAIIMLVSLPWIKLYHMGNKDKLSVRDGIAALLVSMVMMSLLFFVFFKYNPAIIDKTLSQPKTTGDSRTSHNKYPVDSAAASREPKPNKYSREAYPRNMLAIKVTSAFERELDSAYLLLKSIDSVGPLKDGTVCHLNKKSDSLKYKALFDVKSSGIVASQIAWLNTSGKLVSLFTHDKTDDVDAPLGTVLSDRAYFQNVRKNSYNRTSTHKYYIDQVVSRSSNLFESIIAIPSHVAGKIVIMTFRTQSLEKVIMPDGYQFAIVNSSGRVLYHFMPERNLNENLKEEFSDSSKLVSCLEAKSDTTISEEYYGKLYNVKIKPFADMPYFTVIFEDREYSDTRDTESYVFSLGMLICLLLFVVVQFLVIFFSSARRSLFKKQLFDISWIGPKESSHHQYNLSIMTNIVVIILLVLFYELTSFVRYVYILLFSVTFVGIFINAVFAWLYKAKDPHLYRLKPDDPQRYHFKARAIFWLCMFVLMIDILACIKLKPEHIARLFIFEIILTGICTLIFFFGRHLLALARKWLGKRHKKWTYIHSYALMTTTRLVITSGIPVAFFFIYSFNYETRLDTRYRQMKFVKALSQRIHFNSPANTDSVKRYKIILSHTDSVDLARIDSAKLVKLDSVKKIDGVESGTIKKYSDEFIRIYDSTKFARIELNTRVKSNDAKLDSAEKALGVYPDLLFVDSIKDNIRHKGHGTYTGEDSLTAGIMSAFRFHINDVEVKNNNMNLSDIDDTTLFSRIEPNGGKNKSAEHRTRTFFKINPEEYIKVSSENITYPNPSLYSWFFLAVFILLLYFLIDKIIRKLFALDLPSTEGWEELDDKLMDCNALNNLLFIVGSPGSGKLIKLKKKIKNGILLGKAGEKLVLIEGDKTGNAYIADMMVIPSEKYVRNPLWEECQKNVKENDYALVIINHFEYNIKNPATNIAKLDFLEKLMGKENTKVIIISTVHPVSFLDSFNNSDDTDYKNKIPESELERWHVLLGHYRIVIEPLMRDYKPSNCDGEPFNAPNPAKALERMMVDETRYAHFLKKMQPLALSYLGGKNVDDVDPTGDSLMFKLQLTSQYFYTYIWQSLTKEEKFLLYDLAEDGLVNSYDDHNLSILMAKRLIVRVDGTLTLFNKGFRNFILTSIGTTEANRIKDQVKDNGKWGSLKTPLNLIILGILFFLLLSQQESYSRIITYITTIGAGFTAIMRIFPMLGSSSTQKTE